VDVLWLMAASSNPCLHLFPLLSGIGGTNSVWQCCLVTKTGNHRNFACSAFEHNQMPSSSEKDRKKSKQCHKKPFNWKKGVAILMYIITNSDKPFCASKGYRWLGTQLDCNSQNAPHKFHVCLLYTHMSCCQCLLQVWFCGRQERLTDWLPLQVLWEDQCC